MATTVIPEKYADLFQKRAFASLGTLMPDGRPQVTPVWCDFDGQHVIFNSARGRQKDRNVRRDPRVALAIVDPDNPYRYLEIRGTGEVLGDKQSGEIHEIGFQLYTDMLNDAVLALMALGIKQIEAHDAVRAAQTKLGAKAAVEQLVRACLKKTS